MRAFLLMVIIIVSLILALQGLVLIKGIAGAFGERNAQLDSILIK